MPHPDPSNDAGPEGRRPVFIRPDRLGCKDDRESLRNPARCDERIDRYPASDPLPSLRLLWPKGGVVMIAQTEMAPRLHLITVSRTQSGFAVRWQRGGRPTLREFTDLGSAIGQAYTLAAMLNMPVLDLTNSQSAE